MTRARRELVSLDDTPYYHCICRCVRRAFLWGTDHFSGRDYSHRKQWVMDRLGQLSSIFAIEVCAYAVMSNHYHLVLHVDAEQAKGWSEQDVMARWTQLFHLPVLLERYRRGEATSEAENDAARVLMDKLRTRLHDLSWFMRCLNEDLARRANAEDNCKGRFWEGRFKSQALLDEAGLLTCMAYLDLNPVRAGMAETPETSEFTSIYQRIAEIGQTHRETATALPLAPFRHDPQSRPAIQDSDIPFTLTDYLELVDWTGRAIREDKRGHIPAQLPPILERLRIDPAHWVRYMRREGPIFNRAIGRKSRLQALAERMKKCWVCGHSLSQRLFPQTST